MSDPLPPGLYIVATPIGNLGDITMRAADTLRGAALILAEDKRVSAKLLAHVGAKAPMVAYHDHSNDSTRLRIVAEAVDSIPPYVETVERKADGTFVIRAFGEPGLKYEILVTGDLQHSFSLGTYTLPAGGAFDFEDTSAKTEAVSFYTLVSSP